MSSAAPRVIAEAGQCMEGSLPRACRMAADAARAGAWGFKVQWLRPETIATEHAGKYWTDALGTVSQREAFERAGLIPYGSWGPVVDVCRESGIEFITTPFDLDAVGYLDTYEVETVKVASGDITFGPLLAAVAARPGTRTLILSTGAATLDEVAEAVGTILEAAHGGLRIVLLACSLTYPCPDSSANLRRIVTLARYAASVQAGIDPRFARFEVGYSDHTTGTLTAAAAVAAGATWLEKHYTWSRQGRDVPDHAMALDPHDLGIYVENAAQAHAMLGTGDLGVDPAERAAWVGARRSAWLARDVVPGDLIDARDVAYLRPGTGTPAAMASLYIGQRASRPAPAGAALGEAF